MISPARHLASHADASSKDAAVCSSPPSCVGAGMTCSCVDGGAPAADGEDAESGSMYRYICVVKRLELVVGVIQRVKGCRPAIRVRKVGSAGVVVVVVVVV